MKTQLKENIFIEGFEDFESADIRAHEIYPKTGIIGGVLYLGPTSEIPEEIAKECVERIHVEIAPSPFNDFGDGWTSAFVDYQNRGEYAGYEGDAGAFRTAKGSISSAVTKPDGTIYPFIIIYKQTV